MIGKISGREKDLQSRRTKVLLIWRRGFVLIALFILAAVVCTSNGEAGNIPRSVPILMYHKVDQVSYDDGWVTAAKFDAQMAFLKANGFETITLDRFIEYRSGGVALPARPIILTFDDGYQCILKTAAPILNKYGYKATLFVITGATGASDDDRHWLAAEGFTPSVPYLVWPEIVSLAEAGNSLQSHTCSHPYLTRVSQDQLGHELTDSKSEIETRLGQPADFLAYPMGDWNAAVETATRGAGYLGAVTTNSGISNTGTADLFALKRISVKGSLSLAQFAASLIPFPDVPLDFWASREITACWDAKIVQAFPDGIYGPALPVSRGAMAVYVSRAIAGGDENVPAGPATPSFIDVPNTQWAYKYIEYAKAKKVVQGYPAGDYQPSATVDRAQMSVYVARAMTVPTGAGLTDYSPPATADFHDVPLDFWAYKYIEYCKSKNIVAGYPDGMYYPEYAITRDQAAVFVARAFLPFW